MKKILTLILVLATVLSLAACGSTEKADVVDNVDPNDNSVVIETPPAIVSGPDTPVDVYPPATSLPTTAPTTVPETVPTTVPAPTQAPSGNGTGDNSATGNTDGEEERDPDDGYKKKNPTVTQWELDHGEEAYIKGEGGVYFRVGPGKEYEIIRGLAHGTKILLVDELTNGWCKVVYNGDVGYVYGRYVTRTNPLEESVVIVTETPAPTSTPPTVVVVP